MYCRSHSSFIHVKKFTFVKTKTRDLIKNILASHAMKNKIDGLKNANYISILVDTSNHKTIKLELVIARYFCPEYGVKYQILDFFLACQEKQQI